MFNLILNTIVCFICKVTVWNGVTVQETWLPSEYTMGKQSSNSNSGENNN
jgi:hypothetical protein